MTVGKFIVIEGLEGAGKSTAIAHVCKVLNERQLTSQTVREPGGTPLAEALRELVKQHWQERIAEQTELLLMYASRVQLVTNVIKPALASGHWVVGDRHDLSSQAYQGGGRGIDLCLIQQIKSAVLADFNPDITLYMDIDPILGLQRASARGELDRIEQQAIDFFQRTRATYLDLVAQDANAYTIDASQTLAQVSGEIQQQLDKLAEQLL